MPTEVTLLSAFVVGLLGSTHCLGMCGGIVGALTLGVKDRRTGWSLAPFLLAYNVGRISSYAVAGALLGALSASILRAVSASQAQMIGHIISGAFTVALGLYLSGWWLGLGVLERAGAKLWVRIEPVGRRLMPVDHPGKALLLGLLWGWLPCGMVYAVLAWSLASGSAATGAALMAAFGLGTLPMLLAMGAAAGRLAAIARDRWFRRAVGVLLLILGAYILVLAAAGSGHIHGQTT